MLELRSYNVIDHVCVAIDGDQQVALYIHAVFPRPLSEIGLDGGAGMEVENIAWEGEEIRVELAGKA